MKLLTTLAILCLSTVTLAQATFTDPANLRGERVAPLTGRELPIDQGASGLQQLLRKLNTRASIMNIVAHPDDEDGGMMTLYSRGLGARVADISLTRGEGGQNAMTADFEDALGLLRTQELLSCDRYSGTDQFFGTEVDFGFSKTKEESFAKWTHERVLYDVVRAIRLYRPLVLTSTWIGGVTDGHGQHQVSGQIAQEAFVAAGDPKVFPELTAEGILPWQPLRIYARVPMQSISERGLFDYATGEYTPARFTNYVTGEVSTTPPTTDVVVHEGAPDPLLADETGKPRTYVQFARIGLSQQKSQIGPGVRNAPPGTFDVAYHLYGTAICQHNAPTLKNCHPEHREGPAVSPAAAKPLGNPNFFTGIDTSLEGIATFAPDAPSSLRVSLAKISAALEKAQHDFTPTHPEDIAATLISAQNEMQRLMGEMHLADQPNGMSLPPEIESWHSISPAERSNLDHELTVKMTQTDEALALSLGIQIDATAQSSHGNIQTGSSVPVKIHITTTSDQPLKVFSVELGGAKEGDSSAADHAHHPLSSTSPVSLTLTAGSTQTSTITRPYFTRDEIEDPVYRLIQPDLRNAPETPEPLTAWVFASYHDHMIVLGRIVHDGPQPINIIPAVSLSLSTHAQVLPNTWKSLTIHEKVQIPDDEGRRGTFSLNGPDNWKSEPDTIGINMGSGDFEVTPPPGRRALATLNGVVRNELMSEENHQKRFTEGYRPIGYGDLPRTNYFTPATTRIVPVDLKLPTKHNIAYLPGTGDSIPEALTSIGLTPTTLTVSDLTSGHLKQFDTVILGVRAYNAHPDLHGAPTQALLDYARNGGNVVVQYQTTEFTAEDAPYPLSLGSNEKVVDEAAPVHLTPLSSTAQGSELFTTPNLITPADFNNWIEERGHGFLSSWDAHYTPLTETHDPGQSPQRGGLITTSLGKGHWTYCAYALYRQLPEAVPGAYRLFLNLLNP